MSDAVADALADVNTKLDALAAVMATAITDLSTLPGRCCCCRCRG